MQRLDFYVTGTVIDIDAFEDMVSGLKPNQSDYYRPSNEILQGFYFFEEGVFLNASFREGRGFTGFTLSGENIVGLERVESKLLKALTQKKIRAVRCDKPTLRTRVLFPMEGAAA